MNKRAITILLSAALALFAAQSAMAACTVCVGKTGKCYSFKTLNCKDIGLGRGDSCIQGKAYILSTATALSVEASALTGAVDALNGAGITALQTSAASEKGRVVLLVDNTAATAATATLRRARIAFTSVVAQQVEPGQSSHR